MAHGCIQKCNKARSPSDTIAQGKWDTLQSKSKAWAGLDRFGDVYDTTLWENGPAGYYMHKSCYITILSLRLLKQSQQCKQKGSDIAQLCSLATTSDKYDDMPQEPSPYKHLHSSVGGPLHEKTKCVWCMKGEDKKHPNRAQSKLFRINTLSAWHTFRRHPIIIKDIQLRDCHTQLVDSA